MLATFSLFAENSLSSVPMSKKDACRPFTLPLEVADFRLDGDFTLGSPVEVSDPEHWVNLTRGLSASGCPRSSTMFVKVRQPG
jgi:hypothetical protein